MRRREVRSSKFGGEWGVSKVTEKSRAANMGTNTFSSAGATAGAVTATGSALTKCFKTSVVQARVTGAERLQQPCADFCANASSNCGQEKQFPQNRAATINPASTELENVLIKIVG
jgi:hypothetical protein